MQKFYDIIVVGSGMVGASMAAAFKGSDQKVLVIDAGSYTSESLPESYDIRVSAITEASRRFLQSLGVWSELEAFRVAPYREMFVWDAGTDAAIHFDVNQSTRDELGYIVENRAIQHYLLKQIEQAGNIDFLPESQLESFSMNSDETVTVTLQNGTCFSCSVLVGADGGRSKVRELAGIDTSGWQYDQSAVVATIKTEKSLNATAWQCFHPQGPLAFLPLQEHLCSIVWSTTPAHAAELKALPKEEFEIQLADAFEQRLGAVELESERGVFPLQLQYASQYVKPGVALIGDAAHSIHPLAGQGVNLGFLDAACLVDVLQDAKKSGKAIGSMAVLRRYERWRKGDNLAMMYMMDAFKRMFAIETGPLKQVRNSGMRLTNAIQPLKDLILQGASGMRGELPSRVKNSPSIF